MSSVQTVIKECSGIRLFFSTGKFFFKFYLCFYFKDGIGSSDLHAHLSVSKATGFIGFRPLIFAEKRQLITGNENRGVGGKDCFLGSAVIGVEETGGLGGI